MYKSSAFDKKERSLAEIVIIVLMLAILMMSFIHYLFKQEDKFNKVAFDRKAQNFAAKVTTIHAQWFMDKQPAVVNVELSGGTQRITVNRKGWVDVVNQNLACVKIWEVVIMEPMFLMKMPISAVEIKKSKMDLGRICQFELPSGDYFEYNSQNGKVSGALSRSKVN